MEPGRARVDHAAAAERRPRRRAPQNEMIAARGDDRPVDHELQPGLCARWDLVHTQDADPGQALGRGQEELHLLIVAERRRGFWEETEAYVEDAGGRIRFR